MIVFSHKFGQLGNRLFAFSHLIANAAANNISVINLSFDEYAQYFQATSQDTFCRFPNVRSISKSDKFRSALFLCNRAILKVLRKLKVLESPLHKIIVADLPEYQFGEDRHYELNSKHFQGIVHTKRVVFLFGRFFRDYSNFEKYQDVIRGFFRPTLEIHNNVKRLIETLRQNADTVVGVHIRRGDYAQFAGGKYFYTQEDYAHKMETLQLNFSRKKIRYLICSNEKIDDKIFERLDFMTASGHLVEDMYALSECDLIMGPPSTYSLWAAFYGNKPVYQIKDLKKSVTAQDFVMLPPHELYNF